MFTYILYNNSATFLLVSKAMEIKYFYGDKILLWVTITMPVSRRLAEQYFKMVSAKLEAKLADIWIPVSI